ncbi:FAD-dependent monooxygenase [Streptomyces sp. NPDC057301]|uniref:FAD-dependent monooxygenase n=1 Tax=Streptomyces sp. NPDC057301 TaxID=3346093 RepID=UPI003642C72B
MLMRAQAESDAGAGTGDDPEGADVVIVGYGPVGAMVANLLGQAGVRTIVLERDTKQHTMPRAGATDDEVLRVFQAAGLVDQLLPGLDLGQSAQFLSVRGDRLVTMRPSGGRNGFPQVAFFYQPDLERVLHEGVARYPHVTVRMGVRVEGLHEDRGGVTVWAREGDRGRQTATRARYVVACDGGRSTVRGLRSIAFTGSTYAQPWLVVDAKLEAPLTDVTSFQFIGNPDRPGVTLPLPGTHHRWEFMVLPGEDHAELATLENARRLVSPWVDPDRITILRHIVYTFHARAAAQWRSGRVLLAGAAVAAEVLTGDSHHDRVYDVTGPRAFGYEELAAVLADATGQRVRHVSMPSGIAANVLRRRGKPDWYVEHLVEMAELFRAGAGAGATVSTTVRDLTGRPSRTIESFAAEHAGSFTQEGVPQLLHTAARFGLTMAGRAASVLRAG